jgi:glycosyltransferase involved in cell wall biosynthesis
MDITDSKNILILSNHHSYTYNFRKELIKKLLDERYKVYVTFPYGEKVEQLEKIGCKYIESPLDRRGMNPVKDLKLIKSYYSIINNLKPSIVLSYTIKPNIYGGIVCRMLKVPFIANITGLGTALENRGFFQKIIILLYKYAFKEAFCIFFQNEANKDFFMEKGIFLRRYKVIPGSGINIDEFTYQEYPTNNNILKFLYIGRIMRDKGIEELIKAARRLKEDYKNIQFDALGFCEDEYKEKVKLLEKDNIIIFHGVKDNVRKYLSECNAVINPTYHEGMSNVLLEAAAIGRPVLASNIPGCREIFDEGVSGLGFDAKNVDSLIDTIKKFIKLSPDKKKDMGIAGRKKVENEFNRKIVVDAYLKEINRILKDK